VNSKIGFARSSLATLVQQGELSGTDLHAEVRQQGAALGQREIPVAVAKLAQLT
jgi:hypothetical protein